MRYFTGTLSRDGRSLGDVIGDIHLKTEHCDITWDGSGPIPDDPCVSEYRGSMDTQGWKPEEKLIGATVRLSASQGFEMDVLIIRMEGDPWGPPGPFLLGFRSNGAPIVMPEARSLVPARG